MEIWCKLDFIDRLLDLEEYFNFWKICDEEKVWLASNKLDDEADVGVYALKSNLLACYK